MVLAVHSDLQLLLWETHKCEFLDITLLRQLEGTFQMKAQPTAWAMTGVADVLSY